jgi:glucosyl-3-phosphoglycerate synthase
LTVPADAVTLRRAHHGEFTAAALAAAKGSTRISVCLPARDEQGTVGAIVERLLADLVDTVPLVDELLVIDDHSVDGTAGAAAAAGAKVVAAEGVLPEWGLGPGKGQALWKSLFVSEGDLVVWCDADLHDFDSRFVVGLVGPLLADPQLAFTKGFYDRPDPDGVGGGRVTELVARPALALLHPELADVVQPLSGEFAGRRAVLEALPFVRGYGVDLGLLLDVVAAAGRHRLVQVDLGVRHHRNRSLEELSPQAAAVLQVALRRAAVGKDGRVPDVAELRPAGDGSPVTVDGRDLPPLIELPSYRLGHTATT